MHMQQQMQMQQQIQVNKLQFNSRSHFPLIYNLFSIFF